MRQSTVKLAKVYVPTIKFVGGKYPISSHIDEIKPHPCAVDGLLPKSPQCIPVGDFLSKLKQFVVVPYRNPLNINSSTNQKHAFTERPLKENELSSISQLPQKFKMRPMDDIEMDIINGGGAY